jgi:hypothetical protein
MSAVNGIPQEGSFLLSTIAFVNLGFKVSVVTGWVVVAAVAGFWVHESIIALRMIRVDAIGMWNRPREVC